MPVEDASARRQDEILRALQSDQTPRIVQDRLRQTREGLLPWTASLTPAELLLARSHGLKPIATVSATCWMHYGWSWTLGHSQGWSTALHRLKSEAQAAGANAVLDVKMRTLPLSVEDSMDFTLVGTAVRVEGLPPSGDPIVATVPALEFVKLLEADVVPTGIAVGAHYQWMSDWTQGFNSAWNNMEMRSLSQLWEQVRQEAHRDLRANVRNQGNGVLAHINFSQMFKREVENQPSQFLARHIVVATTLDAQRPSKPLPEINIVVDLHAGKTPLKRHGAHHQSYASNESDGAI